MIDTTPAGSLEFFAACPRHVPDVLATELRGLGLNVTREHPAGVSFSGTLRDAYLACLASRTASRVLLTLGTIPLDTVDTMYAAIRAVAWEDHLAPEGTLAFDVVGQGPAWLRHTQFAAQKAKDAIVDRWQHLGTAEDDTAVAALLEQAPAAAFDPDSYRIIARYLERLAPRDLVMLGESRG